MKNDFIQAKEVRSFMTKTVLFIGSDKIFFCMLLSFSLLINVANAQTYDNETAVLDTMSVKWISEHLKKNSPKIILTAHQLKEIRQAIKKDNTVKAYYTYLYKNATTILKLPRLKRELKGRRLLTVSREAVNRIGILSIVFAVSNENRFLKRLNAELIDVCNFSDWNPSHFLDVGEMAYGVAIGLDWSLNKLPSSTIALAKKTLVEKALKPSLNKRYNSWVTKNNNWNQVCHGGLSIAAIAVADQYSSIAVTIINRAVKNIPIALKKYGPDGVYLEGASYWAYGTSYTLLTLGAFQSAFGTDFNLSKTPGFIQSALFVEMLTAPSGLYYNYFDSGTGNEWGLEKYELLSWFAVKTKNGNYFDQQSFLNKLKSAPANGKHISRLSGAALCWMLNTKNLKQQPFPKNWKGDGANPIIVFKSRKLAPSSFYLAAKGGTANLSHGNMDAGSFVFELNGVRWSVDLGLQPYTKLEEAIGVKGLWSYEQDSKRWSLLSKSNFGHSTLTVNGQLFKADGNAALISYTNSATQPMAKFDLSNLFPGTLASATRKFKKLSDEKLEIEDSLVLTPRTDIVTWAMMTQADAEITTHGFLLTQNGKKLQVNLIGALKAVMKITLLNPPPLTYDMRVDNLKRITFDIGARDLKEHRSKIIVHLSAKDVDEN